MLRTKGSRMSQFTCYRKDAEPDAPRSGEIAL